MSRRVLAEQLADWVSSFTSKPAKGGLDELLLKPQVPLQHGDSVAIGGSPIPLRSTDNYTYKGDSVANQGLKITEDGIFHNRPSILDEYTGDFDKSAWQFLEETGDTGSGKLNANRTVNPDMARTYDGSELPMSLDPDAVKLPPNGQTTPIAPVTEQDVVLDAGNNFVNQPAEGLNSVAIKNMPEDTAGLLTQGDSPLASMMEDSSSIGTATRERLFKLPQRVKDEMMEAPDKESMMAILRKYHTGNNNSVLTKNDINGLSRENLSLTDNTDRAVANANKSDTHFTQSVSGADEVPLADVVMKDIGSGFTDADAIADAKAIKNLYYNKQKSPDDVLNALTRKLTDIQAKPTTIENKKLIESIQFAMKDIVDNSYRGVYQTSNSPLSKTPKQSLNRIGREITEGADNKIVNLQKYDTEEQLFKELEGGTTPKNLDEIEDGMTFDGSGNGLGKEYTDSITDILDELKNRKLDPKKKSTPKVNKRIKRSRLNSKEEEELMPWLQDFPDYGRGRITKKKDLFDELEAPSISSPTTVTKNTDSLLDAKATTNEISDEYYQVLNDAVVGFENKMPRSQMAKQEYAVRELFEKEGIPYNPDAQYFMSSHLYDMAKNNGGSGRYLVSTNDKGIPLASAETQIYKEGKRTRFPRRKEKVVRTDPAIYIPSIGSHSTKATDDVIEQAKQLARENNIKHIVMEDVTSEGAVNAFKKRGFIDSKKGFFEGEPLSSPLEWRNQKAGDSTINLVLEVN